MDGLIYNPNLKNYGDEIKFMFKMKTNGKNEYLKELDIVSCFGCVPADDPRPDYMVWKPLSVYKFIPDQNLKISDYDTSTNSTYKEPEVTDSLNVAHENLNHHFVTNTEKSDKGQFCFRFPVKNQSELEIYGKLKIGRS